MVPMKTAVCILNWNGFDDTQRCLASLAEHCKEARIYLLENGSGQGDRLRGIIDGRTALIVSEENLGFPAGCNLLLRRALQDGAEAILLLNNDAEVTAGFLDEPLRLLSDPGVGFVQSKLVMAGTERLDNAGHRHLNSGDVIPEGRGRPASAYACNRAIFSACAAALLLKAGMLREVGLFEEEFFLGYEDVDLTSRAAMMGWRGVFCASSRVSHRVNASIEKVRDEAYYTRSQRNALLAYLYNTPAIVIALNAPWIALKYLGVTLFGVIALRLWMLRVYWRALLEVCGSWRRVRDRRRALLPRRRLGALAIWRLQRNCIPAYLRLIPAALRAPILRKP